MVAMKLSHPNIATVRAFEEDEGGNPFLVMDYVEGEGLDDILAEKGALGEEETLRILGPVAAALDYAHGKGVVHRDVKPGNVMVAKDGTPFVLDFGIAREVQETMTRVTGKLSSGTLLYMSPEQLHGRAPKAAQDVYSFAAMAYECLTGGPPFSRGQIEYQIDHDMPEELPGSVGATLRKGVMEGLTKEAGGRPGSCTGVLGKTQLSENSAEEVLLHHPKALEEHARIQSHEAELAREPVVDILTEKEVKPGRKELEELAPLGSETKAAKKRLAGWLWIVGLLLVVASVLVAVQCPKEKNKVLSKKLNPQSESPALASFAERYGLAMDVSSAPPSLSGNFRTRSERLAATADLYTSFPGIALDLTDDESLRGSVADSLFTLGQSNLTVAAVSNRVATLAGLADSPADLSAAIDALRADVPRLAEVDASAVEFRSPVALASAPATGVLGTSSSRRRGSRAASTNAPAPPFCGIRTTPYPCLVLQNGTRVFPGATLGDYVISSISADSVVLTNATNSLTWKP